MNDAGLTTSKRGHVLREIRRSATTFVEMQEKGAGQDFVGHESYATIRDSYINHEVTRNKIPVPPSLGGEA